MQFFTHTKGPLFCNVFEVSNFVDHPMWNISGGPMLNEVLIRSNQAVCYRQWACVMILRLPNRSGTKLCLLLKFCCQIWLSKISLERSFLATCSSDASTLSQGTPHQRLWPNPIYAMRGHCSCQNQTKPSFILDLESYLMNYYLVLVPGVHLSFDVLPSWADQRSCAHKCIC